MAKKTTKAAAPSGAVLTLGPNLFNWTPERWRDFYFRIADEAAVEVVHVGEVVCSKRAPFFAEHIPAVIERLAAGGKEVVLSSPALVTTDRERAGVVDLVEGAEYLIEANDIGILRLLSGKPHAIGPLVNVYNEATLVWMAGRGATRVCLPPELSREALAAIAASAAAGPELEVMVFGRLPLTPLGGGHLLGLVGLRLPERWHWAGGVAALALAGSGLAQPVVRPVAAALAPWVGLG